MKAGAPRGIAAAAVALLLGALLIAVPAAQSGAATVAQTAKKKKKCKPKVPYGAVAAKKKRCPKVAKMPPIAIPTDPSTPATPSVLTTRERARVTWTAAGKDIDLYVWDQAGRKTFQGSDEIPAGSHSGDTQTAGFESFTDEQWYEPPPSGGNRNFTYGMCLLDTGPVTATFTALLAGGGTYSVNVSLNTTAGQLVTPAGGYVPPDENAWC